MFGSASLCVFVEQYCCLGKGKQEQGLSVVTAVGCHGEGRNCITVNSKACECGNDARNISRKQIRAEQYNSCSVFWKFESAVTRN
jgi:hypothetical protein